MVTVKRLFARLLVLIGVFAAGTASSARADTLRNVSVGEPIPEFRMTALDGSTIDSTSMRGSVVVMVCLSAEQRRSELASLESMQIVRQFGDFPVRLVHVTADVARRDYFERCRADRQIDAPLALDSDHAFFSQLGLIVFPTTLVIDREGRLAHVISLHSANYGRTLEADVLHALGEIDEQTRVARATAPSEDAAPPNQASAHRGLARSLREKGLTEAARTELRRALELNPADHEAALDLADIDLEVGALDEADAIVAKVLGERPADPRGREIRGLILYYRGDREAAEAILEEAAALNPAPQRIHYYLGRIAEDRGDTQTAAKHYREALRRFFREPGPAGNPTPTPRE